MYVWCRPDVFTALLFVMAVIRRDRGGLLFFMPCTFVIIIIYQIEFLKHLHAVR